MSAGFTHLGFRIEELNDHNIYAVQDQEDQEVSPRNRRNRKCCRLNMQDNETVEHKVSNRYTCL
jgi:hypothetical protein